MNQARFMIQTFGMFLPPSTMKEIMQQLLEVSRGTRTANEAKDLIELLLLKTPELMQLFNDYLINAEELDALISEKCN